MWKLGWREIFNVLEVGIKESAFRREVRPTLLGRRIHCSRI